MLDLRGTAQHVLASFHLQDPAIDVRIQDDWSAFWLDWTLLNKAAIAFSHGPGCQLLGPLGIAVQIGITIVCAIALVSVWLFEDPRRPFLVWAFDISKQVIGAAYGKLYNITQSVVFSSMLRSNNGQSDQCVWYLMSIATDCLFMTFLLWGATSFVRPILLERCDIDIGDYDEPVENDARTSNVSGADLEKPASKETRETCTPGQVHAYLVQLGIWLAIITVVRLFVSVILFFAQADLYVFYENWFVLLELESPESRLIFAVLVFPAAADTFQIVVQDLFLKKQK